MNCRYCAHRNGGHDSECPDLAQAGSTERKLYMASWQCGYDDGRTGKMPRFTYPTTPEQKQAQEPAEAAYHLGYGRGEVGLEEAENGCTSWAE